MGVWIETFVPFQSLWKYFVTPFVGVWIETDLYIPLRERIKVTPFVGVWIETNKVKRNAFDLCHTLRGCVD